MVGIVQDFIPYGRRNRPGYKLDPRYITIHDTANTQAGADARAHANYVKTAPDLLAGWHFTVDDRVIYQHLPLNENGWHAGDGTDGAGNRQSIGIEICENRDGDRPGAEANAAWLTAKLLRDFGLDPDRVKQHYHWSGKNCPRVLRGRVEGWTGFLAAVRSYLTPQIATPITGTAQAAVRQAQEWARARLAHQRFIDIAPFYWRYGVLTGIRPEVLYAQSARETAFGRYGGVVLPEQNNWAGIKTANPAGDAASDHESFPTPEDGVRGHFNHIAAYVGLEPVGIPHGRYWVIKKTPWAGTVKTVEALGGKWAPDPNYGSTIVRGYLGPLLLTGHPPEAPGESGGEPGEPPSPGQPDPSIPWIIRLIQLLLEKLKELLGVS
jgi:hypothetical protein